ncbi:hypothetical protein B6V76_12915 [Thioclava sp. IC9]|nr:hypothetical protein B6V76_12915 [Thioclava sp. IC9]
MQRPDGLPDYTDPPLVEVVLGLQFDQIKGLKSVHYGPIHQTFVANYPILEEKPTLAPAFEVPNVFGEPRPLTIQHRPFELPRLWMLSQDESRLIQFQGDRFIMNWRKRNGDHQYPRYEAIREEFRGAFAAMSKSLEALELAAVVPNQVEVTYVNIISLPDEEDVLCNPERAISILNEDEWNDPDKQKEDTSFSIRDGLSWGNGTWAGRMTVQAQPVQGPKGERAIQLSIMVRGKPLERNLESAMEFMDWARKKIVNRFTSVTTDRMHKIWGRKI